MSSSSHPGDGVSLLSGVVLGGFEVSSSLYKQSGAGALLRWEISIQGSIPFKFLLRCEIVKRT